MNRSGSDSSSLSTTSPVSNTSTNSYINPNSPWVIAAEHHKHGCCTGRYHCDGSKCPDAPVLNPALGIPLAICTGGLSAAAFGMYRGFRDHKSRKEMKKAYVQAQAQQKPLPPVEFATPSHVARSSGSEKGVSTNSSNVPFIAEMDGSSTIPPSSALSEKMDDTTPPLARSPPKIPEKLDDREAGIPSLSEKMDDENEEGSNPSEIDSTPVGSLPRYSELGSPR